MRIPISKRLKAQEVPGPPPLSGIIPKSIRKVPGALWASAAVFDDQIHKSDLILRSRARACDPKIPPKQSPLKNLTDKSKKQSVSTYSPLEGVMVVWGIKKPKLKGNERNKFVFYHRYRNDVMDYAIKNSLRSRPNIRGLVDEEESGENDFIPFSFKSEAEFLEKPKPKLNIVIPHLISHVQRGVWRKVN